ncbi:MAG: hypothetical protein AB8B73_16130 [Ekhidna sp.]
MKCLVYDEDKFTRELVLGFIKKTDGLISISQQEASEADILFVDAAIYDGDYRLGLQKDTKIVIVSSNKQYIHSFFQNEIEDYLMKSELSLERFEMSIRKIRGIIEEKVSA